MQILNKILKFSSSIFLLVVILSGCSGLSAQKIDIEEIPSNVWEEDLQFVQMNSISLSQKPKTYQSNDCPGTQTRASRADGSVCKEARIWNPERNCNEVFSTYGNGYCPTIYESGEYGSKSAKLDNIVAAGSAAQQAVLELGNKMAMDAQRKSIDFLENHKFNNLVLDSNAPLNKITTELVPQYMDQYKPGDLLALTRTGYYTNCILPKFDAAYVYTMGNWYIRLLKDRLLCIAPDYDKNDYVSDYINYKSSENKTTYLLTYDLSLQKEEKYSITIREPIFGMSASTIEDLVKPSDFETNIGFVELTNSEREFLSIFSINENSVTLEYSNSNTRLELKKDKTLKFKGLSLELLEIKDDLALIKIRT